MNKEIINKNDKGQWHGYVELYYLDKTIQSRGNWKNGFIIGYSEYHEIETIYKIR